MKKYFTEEAKRSAINRLTELIDIVATTPGNVIGYLDARAIIDVLADRKEDLQKELKK